MSRLRRVLVVLAGALSAAALATAGTAGRASAQTLNFASSESDLPIEVQADNGIEWQQGSNIFLARGNARATRGDVTLRADLLRAYYRRNAKGGTEISRLEAVGHVEIKSPDETATGDTGVYDVDQAILVLSGKKVRLVTAEDVITADRQLEYYDLKHMAVARGNAVAKRADRTLRTDVLVAYFSKDKGGKSRIHRVDAFDNVHIVTAADKVWADRGVYNVDTGMATLTGEVRLERDNNTLTGCSAEVNLNTGVSKLKSCAGSGQRVRGLLVPKGTDRGNGK